MNHYKRASPAGWLAALAYVVTSLLSAAALADGAKQGFPPSLHQLEEAALATAAFNVGPRTVANYPAGLPYQILYFPDAGGLNNTGGTNLTFFVSPGTRLYVPVMFNTNSIPIIGDFPPAGDRAALLHYFFSQEQMGLEFARITVDGEETTLGARYIVEVDPGIVLADGGTLYQAVAAILTPLKKGTHTVTISVRATGDALSVPPLDQFFPGGVFEFSATYTVIVQ